MAAMTPHFYLFLVVLNDRQLVAKRRLIEENRERRRKDAELNAVKQQTTQCFYEGGTTQDDRTIISDIMYAYEQTAAKQEMPYVVSET